MQDRRGGEDHVTGSRSRPTLPRLRKSARVCDNLHTATPNFLNTTTAVDMAVKRPHEGDAKSSVKKQKQKGRFDIGPANLPDGTHRRKSRFFSNIFFMHRFLAEERFREAYRSNSEYWETTQ